MCFTLVLGLGIAQQYISVWELLSQIDRVYLNCFRIGYSSAMY